MFRLLIFADFRHVVVSRLPFFFRYMAFTAAMMPMSRSLPFDALPLRRYFSPSYVLPCRARRYLFFDVIVLIPADTVVLLHFHIFHADAAAMSIDFFIDLRFRFSRFDTPCHASYCWLPPPMSRQSAACFFTFTPTLQLPLFSSLLMRSDVITIIFFALFGGRYHAISPCLLPDAAACLPRQMPPLSPC